VVSNAYQFVLRSHYIMTTCVYVPRGYRGGVLIQDAILMQQGDVHLRLLARTQVQKRGPNFEGCNVASVHLSCYLVRITK